MSITVDKFIINFETGIPQTEKVVAIKRTNTLTNCNFSINFKTGIPKSEKVVTILRGNVIPPELIPPPQITDIFFYMNNRCGYRFYD